MEEIGSRATIFELEGLGNEKRKYLKWLLVQSVALKTKIENVITDNAVAMLSEKLAALQHGDESPGVGGPGRQ
jgi:hypothetical protein